MKQLLGLSVVAAAAIVLTAVMPFTAQASGGTELASLPPPGSSAAAAGAGAPSSTFTVMPESTVDSRLADAVAGKLFLDRFVSPEAVQVGGKDGVIRLDGTVADLREAELVRRMAEGVRGVRRVDSHLSARVTARTDADVREAVLNALAADPATDSLGVGASVAHGTLELTGKVLLHSSLELAQWVAEGVPGVREVRNHIQLRHPETDPTDRELGVSLRAELRRDVWLSEDPVDFHLKAGRVTLSGQVGSAAERARAIALAWLPGVVAVDGSRLAIDPGVRERAGQAIFRREAAASDDNLRADIIDSFRFDGRLAGKSPQVTVRDRVATLRGTAEDLAEKRAAEDDAWNIAGVLDVVDKLELTSSTGHDPTDSELAVAVTGALRAGLTAETWNRIAIAVKKGSVIVTGNVPTAYERWEARDIAARTRGIVGIDNRVRIVPVIEGTRQAGLTDEELRDRAWLALGWDPLLGSLDHLTLTVAGGVITLTGRVRSLVRAVQAARDAFDAGAAGVKSELAIGDAPEHVIRLERGKGGGEISETPGNIVYSIPPPEAFPSFREPQT